MPSPQVVGFVGIVRLVVAGVVLFNRLVTLRQRVNEAWADMDRPGQRAAQVLRRSRAIEDSQPGDLTALHRQSIAWGLSPAGQPLRYPPADHRRDPALGGNVKAVGNSRLGPCRYACSQAVNLGA